MATAAASCYWSVVTNCIYRLYYWPAGGPTNVIPTSANLVSVPGLNLGTTYNFAVSAVSPTAGEGPTGSVVSWLAVLPGIVVTILGADSAAGPWSPVGSFTNTSLAAQGFYRASISRQ